MASSLTARRLTGTIAYVALSALAIAIVGLLPMDDYAMHILVQTATFSIAVFGLTVVSTGVPLVTVKPFARVTISVPVVTVALLAPAVDVALTDTTAVAVVAEVTVSEFTVMPLPPHSQPSALVMPSIADFEAQ